MWAFTLHLLSFDRLTASAPAQRFLRLTNSAPTHIFLRSHVSQLKNFTTHRGRPLTTHTGLQVLPRHNNSLTEVTTNLGSRVLVCETDNEKWNLHYYGVKPVVGSKRSPKPQANKA